MNSKLGWFLIKNTCTQVKDGYQLIWKYFGNVPISTKASSKLEELVSRVLSLNKRHVELIDKITDERQRIEEEIKLLDKQIDELVFDL